MDYCSVRETAEKWGVTQRQVQLLCQKGAVPGTVRFNGGYAIPADASKPLDRRKKWAEDTQSCRPAAKISADRFREIFDHFPYRVNVSAADGTMVYANRAFLEGTLEGIGEAALGNYSILREENLMKWGLAEHVKKAFSGETAFTPNLEFPNRMMVGTRYGKEYAFLSLYHDITSFPLLDAAGRLEYVVTVFVPVRQLNERLEVQRGREYMEAHWAEPFDIAATAAAAAMSASRFARVFREDAGFSPHEYYKEQKIKHVLEMLRDVNLSVAQAFAVCGLDYNSYNTAIFKRNAGMTPSQYRKAFGKAQMK